MVSYNSPGVYEVEIDLSTYIPNPVDTVAAVVGPFGRGPIGQPVFSATFDEWQAVFGPVKEEYPGSMGISDYFESQGNQLWTVRSAHEAEAMQASATVPLVGTSPSNQVFESLDFGDDYNNCVLDFSYYQPAQETYTKACSLTVSSSQSISVPTSNGKPIVPKTVTLLVGSTTIATDDGNGNLIFVTGYSTYSGTINYNNGVASITVTGVTTAETLTIISQASAYQTFTMQVIYSLFNQEGMLLSTTIVETLSGINCSNSSSIFAGSNYVYGQTSSPNLTSFPVAGSYPMSGGDSGVGSLSDTDIVGNTIGGVPSGMQCFANPNSISINTLAVPGYSAHTLVRNAMLQLCTNSRSDTFPIFESYETDTKENVVAWANSTGQYSNNGVLSTNRGAVYYPGANRLDPTSGDNMLAPPSGLVLAAMAQGHYYDAPAGYQFQPPNITSMVVDLAPGDRDYLQENRINPIGDYEGLGIMILGQLTATLIASALNRVANRIILNRIEQAMKKALFIYMFKANNQTLWNKMTATGQGLLNSLTNQGILNYGQFVCNVETNTTAVQEQNQTACYIELVLPTYAEAIILNFVINSINQTISTNYTTASGVQLA